MAYDGTAYAGFQVQPNAPTVQGELERVLAVMCGEPVRITGAGRTDAGVHATGQVIDLRTTSGLGPADLERGVNALLPEDIAISELGPAEDSFHARFSATGRTYEYRIRNAAVRDPLRARREHWHPGKLDVAAMRAAAARLVGRHDFAAFAAGDPGVRSVKRAEWISEGDILRFEIESDAFLRGMVRGIVGTLLWVGRGKITVERFAEVLHARDRALAGPSAPAKGLCLVAVRYGGERRRQDGSENWE
ncbi:MAG TPA: tRNA pseudouridine(38-40) synthase TruA [Candidatus Limnocylindria bacterium]|nr:tRNA pseudouridine(38-40) synthase TruA [Candidatus Limnocylindria bacterium]